MRHRVALPRKGRRVASSEDSRASLSLSGQSESSPFERAADEKPSDALGKHSLSAADTSTTAFPPSDETHIWQKLTRSGMSEGRGVASLCRRGENRIDPGDGGDSFVLALRLHVRERCEMSSSTPSAHPAARDDADLYWGERATQAGWDIGAPLPPNADSFGPQGRPSARRRPKARPAPGTAAEDFISAFRPASCYGERITRRVWFSTVVIARFPSPRSGAFGHGWAQLYRAGSSKSPVRMKSWGSISTWILAYLLRIPQ